MAGYAKVFDSILTSSLWCKDHHVLRIWIAMLARCNSQGVVEGSIPGFASLCRVSDQQMEEAVAIFTRSHDAPRARRAGGIEPPRPCSQLIFSQPRLPIPPRPH